MRWKDTCRMFQCCERGIISKRDYSCLFPQHWHDTNEDRCDDSKYHHHQDYRWVAIYVTICHTSPACPAAYGHQKGNRIGSKTNCGFWTCHCHLSEIRKSQDVTSHSEQIMNPRSMWPHGHGPIWRETHLFPSLQLKQDKSEVSTAPIEPHLEPSW